MSGFQEDLRCGYSPLIAAMHDIDKKRRRSFSADDNFQCIGVHSTNYSTRNIKEGLLFVYDHSSSTSVDEAEFRSSTVSNASSSVEAENDLDIFDDANNAFETSHPFSGVSASLMDFIPSEMRTPLRTRYGKIPRLLKNDIRRFYPNMLINALNSQDHSMLSQFFKKFFVPDATLELLKDLSSVWHSEKCVKSDIDSNIMTNESTLNEHNNRKSLNNVVRGTDNLFLYFLLIFRAFPDWCLSLQHVEIKRSNYRHSCQVTFHVRLSWTEMIAHNTSAAHPTKVEDLTPFTAETNLLVIDSNNQNHCAYLRSQEQDSQQVPTQKWETMKYEVEAASTMELNEDWRVSHIESVTIASTVSKLAPFSF